MKKPQVFWASTLVGRYRQQPVFCLFFQVLSVAINDANIVKHIQQTLNNYEIALRIASQANLGGADDLFTQKFRTLLAEMNIQEVAQLYFSLTRVCI
jgi:hypothetical protein